MREKLLRAHSPGGAAEECAHPEGPPHGERPGGPGVRGHGVVLQAAARGGRSGSSAERTPSPTLQGREARGGLGGLGSAPLPGGRKRMGDGNPKCLLARQEVKTNSLRRSGSARQAAGCAGRTCLKESYAGVQLSRWNRAQTFTRGSAPACPLRARGASAARGRALTRKPEVLSSRQRTRHTKQRVRKAEKSVGEPAPPSCARSSLPRTASSAAATAPARGRGGETGGECALRARACAWG